jgi:hypothetical protein
MEEALANWTVPNGTNLGRLHPDFPMDPSTDRFERKLWSNMDRVKKAEKDKKILSRQIFFFYFKDN